MVADRFPTTGRSLLDNRKTIMNDLSPRHVLLEESLRLGVESGWYSTKVSGTFVTGPHATREECCSRIAEFNPPPLKAKPRAVPVPVPVPDADHAS
jgi:hypothetical protein